MGKRYLLILSFVLAIAIGTFLPQLIVENVESSSDEITYQFVNLGMTTEESRQQIEEILDGIVGISDFQIDPISDVITITLDPETMKPEWVMKSLDSHGYAAGEYHKLK